MLTNSDKHYINTCAFLVLSSTAKTDSAWWIFVIMAGISMILHVRSR